MVFNWFKKKKKKTTDIGDRKPVDHTKNSEKSIDLSEDKAASPEDETTTLTIPDSDKELINTQKSDTVIKETKIDTVIASDKDDNLKKADNLTVTKPESKDDSKTHPFSENETESAPTLAQPAENKHEQPKDKPRTGFFKRLKTGLTRTRDFLNTDIEDLFKGNRRVDDDLLEELEELLITSDLGVSTTMDLMEKITEKASKITSAEKLKEILKEEILKLMKTDQDHKPVPITKPHVIMVIGVNGVGKTTTIGKLAARYKEQGKKVLIAAADTFRAAAVEQLEIWADRSGSQFVHHRENADPAAVAYDGVEAAIARDIDVVLIDTAGRLHTQVNLMEELKKIKRSVTKKIPSAPHEILIVVDATTGQNALSQAKLFNDAINITGIALTKLDGTAKGGIVISICDSFNIPLKYIGVGEQIDDLQEFNSEDFINALF